MSNKGVKILGLDFRRERVEPPGNKDLYNLPRFVVSFFNSKSPISPPYSQRKNHVAKETRELHKSLVPCWWDAKPNEMEGRGIRRPQR